MVLEHACQMETGLAIPEGQAVRVVLEVVVAQAGAAVQEVQEQEGREEAASRLGKGAVPTVRCSPRSAVLVIKVASS
jgi:hypothetical protein